MAGGPKLRRTDSARTASLNFLSGSIKPLHGVDCWVKVKNPKAPAIRREAEEDWGSPHWIRSKTGPGKGSRAEDA